MKIDPKKYNSILEDNLNKRFSQISAVRVRKINKGYNLDDARNWRYLKVEHISNFYLNGEKRLNFFIGLEFPRENGLRNKIEKNKKSGNLIDKLKLLSRPHREYMNGEEKQLEKNSPFKKYINELAVQGEINPDKDYYFISCRIKKIPKNPNKLINNIWGNLIAPSAGSIMGFL